MYDHFNSHKKVQAGNDQEKAQSGRTRITRTSLVTYL